MGCWLFVATQRTAPSWRHCWPRVPRGGSAASERATWRLFGGANGGRWKPFPYWFFNDVSWGDIGELRKLFFGSWESFLSLGFWFGLTNGPEFKFMDLGLGSCFWDTWPDPNIPDMFFLDMPCRSCLQKLLQVWRFYVLAIHSIHLPHEMKARMKLAVRIFYASFLSLSGPPLEANQRVTWPNICVCTGNNNARSNLRKIMVPCYVTQVSVWGVSRKCVMRSYIIISS